MPCTFYPLSPSDNILQSCVQYCNQDIDIDKIHQSCTDFPSFTVVVYVCVRECVCVCEV